MESSVLLSLGMERISSYVSVGTDLMVKRQYNQLIFDVYRKPTSTKRYITADSFHPQSQKNAAFHSMAHRLCNFNLSEEKYLKKGQHRPNRPNKRLSTNRHPETHTKTREHQKKTRTYHLDRNQTTNKEKNLRSFFYHHH
jgi:hypothetical protein